MLRYSVLLLRRTHLSKALGCFLNVKRKVSCVVLWFSFNHLIPKACYIKQVITLPGCTLPCLV